VAQSSPPDDSDAHRCQQCGHSVQSTANFCPQCGTAVGATYCPDCGEPFGETGAFCSHCGTERPTAAGSAPHDTESETYEQFRRRVASYQQAGWDITADHGDRVTVVNRGIGSIGVHILLLLFSGGLLNLAYGWYHYSALAETRQLVVGGSATSAASPSTVEETNAATATDDTVMAYVTAGLLWFISLTFLAVAIGGSSVGMGLIGLLFAAGGTYVLPPAKRRFGRRLGFTKFGRHKTVDHRIIHPTEATDESCVVCGTEFDAGLLRRRRDETVVAGIPVRTHQLETNHYCADCALEEPFTASNLDGLDEFADLETEPATPTTD